MDLFTDPEKDINPVRKIVLTDRDETTFTILPEGPFGFFTVHRERGSVPAELQGQYTSYKYAEQALREYLSKFPSGHNKKIKEVKDTFQKAE